MPISVREVANQKWCELVAFFVARHSKGLVWREEKKGKVFIWLRRARLRLGFGALFWFVFWARYRNEESTELRDYQVMQVMQVMQVFQRNTKR